MTRGHAIQRAPHEAARRLQRECQRIRFLVVPSGENCSAVSRERSAIWRGLSAPKSHASDRRARARVTVEHASTCACLARVVNSAARAAQRGANGVSTSRLVDFSTPFDETSVSSSMILVPFVFAVVQTCIKRSGTGRGGYDTCKRTSVRHCNASPRSPVTRATFGARGPRQSAMRSRSRLSTSSLLDFSTSRLVDSTMGSYRAAYPGAPLPTWRFTLTSTHRPHRTRPYSSAMALALAFTGTAAVRHSAARWRVSTGLRPARVGAVFPCHSRGRHPTAAATVSCLLVPRSVQRQSSLPNLKRDATRAAASQHDGPRPPPSDGGQDASGTEKSLRARRGKVPARCMSGPTISKQI